MSLIFLVRKLKFRSGSGGVWGLCQFVSCLVGSPNSQQRTWQIPDPSLLDIVRVRKCLLGGADVHSVQRWGVGGGRGIDLHVRNVEELSKMHEINDVQCEHSRAVCCFAVV